MTGARPEPPRLVVFDLDGTLVDSLQDLTESANALLEACGRRPLAPSRVGAMVGDGAAVLVARVFAASGGDAPADALSRFLAIYNGRLLKHTRPYTGIVHTLDSLVRRVPLAVLTNKPLQATLEILAGLDLARFFASGMVVGGDGPFPRKPEPSGLLHLAALANVPIEQTVLVGDSAIDWQTARAAGCAVCLVAYGFGFAGVPLGDLVARELVAQSPLELADLL